MIELNLHTGMVALNFLQDEKEFPNDSESKGKIQKVFSYNLLIVFFS